MRSCSRAGASSCDSRRKRGRQGGRVILGVGDQEEGEGKEIENGNGNEHGEAEKFALEVESVARQFCLESEVFSTFALKRGGR